MTEACVEISGGGSRAVCYRSIVGCCWSPVTSKLISYFGVIWSWLLPWGQYQSFLGKKNRRKPCLMADYTSSSLKFPTAYVCQKLWKLVDSRQSNCNNNRAYFLAHSVDAEH